MLLLTQFLYFPVEPIQLFLETGGMELSIKHFVINLCRNVVCYQIQSDEIFFLNPYGRIIRYLFSLILITVNKGGKQ